MSSTLTHHVAYLSRLILEGKTLEAMEQFYDEDVEMQENETPPRRGKRQCMERERKNLAGVAHMSARLLHQAINPEQGVVFSEWEFVFDDPAGQTMRLTEVSVQHWRGDKVLREKFYYQSFEPVSNPL